MVRGSKKMIRYNKTKQCPYCNNFFIKTEKKMQEHVNLCAGQAGFSFSCDNGKIVNYQDNFKKMGDLPFAIYYDFKTMTGSVVFFIQKCTWSATAWLLPFIQNSTYPVFLFIVAMIKTRQI